MQETDAALRKAKKERKKCQRVEEVDKCCANLSFLGRLESIGFVSFASGFHLGGPASQGSGCDMQFTSTSCVVYVVSAKSEAQWQATNVRDTDFFTLALITSKLLNTFTQDGQIPAKT